MKKETFFEVLGELDDNIVKGAKSHMKKQVSWKVWSTMAACVALAAVLGIGALHHNAPANGELPGRLKPVINFEGVVEAVEGERVVLKDGTIILITEDTKFMGDPDTGNAVSKDILVGNFIQGYTEDDANAEEITAGKIWTNEGRRTGNEKRTINFEGRVTHMEQEVLVLDSGKRVVLAEDATVVRPENSTAEIAVGDYIQGYAEDADGPEVTASYILITTL